MCSECNVELTSMYNSKCIIIIILQPVVYELFHNGYAQFIDVTPTTIMHNYKYLA